MSQEFPFGPGLIGAMRQTWRGWRDEGSTRQGAALAFYALFAVAPVLLLVTRLSGAILGESAAEAQLAAQLQVLMPADVAGAVQGLVRDASIEVTEWSTAIGSLLAATWAGVRGFLHLQGTLNQIWGVVAIRGPGVGEMLRRKLIAFGSVALTGALLVATLCVAMLLSEAYSGSAVTPAAFWQVWLLHELTAFVMCFAFVAVVYRVLPDVHIAWADVLIGGAVTAVLLGIGRQLVAFWLAAGDLGSSYGAAGSLVGVLLFAYYSANTLLFGAQLTQVLAMRRGEPIVPNAYAARIERKRVETDVP